MGLYNADIAGLLGGIGGGIPLIPIDVEVDDEALAFIVDDDTDSFPMPLPPPLITLCIIDEDPPLVPEDELLFDDCGPDILLDDIFIILPPDGPEDIVDETPEDGTEDDKESPESTEEVAIDDPDISDLPLEDPGPGWIVVFKPPIPVLCCLGTIVAEEE